MIKSRYVEARLIQDIGNFVYLVLAAAQLSPAIGLIDERRFRELLKWIICEELELVYGLFDATHIHNHPDFQSIHNDLATRLDLSRWFAAMVAVPEPPTNDNTVEVSLIGNDLTLTYTRVADGPWQQFRFHHQR
jgi:hypothetical protein